LGWGNEREHNEEDKLCHFLRNRGLNVTEDPADSDGHEDGQIDTEFLFSVSLIGFGGSSESFLDFSTDQKEKDHIHRNNKDSGHKEGSECDVRIHNIARSSIGAASRKKTILFNSTNNDHNDCRSTPCAKMIPLFMTLGFTISFHDHSIKVESNAKGPAEVCQKKVMCKERHYDTQRELINDEGDVRDTEEGVSKHDTYT